MRNSYIGQAWLVLVLALCFGGSLAGVDSALRDRIAANKLAATVEQIPALVSHADLAASRAQASEPLIITVGQGALASTYPVYRAVRADGQMAGWVIKAGGKGFADRIELLIGVNTKAERITGLYVLDQKETPGLGNKITEKDFLWPFGGGELRTDRPVTVVTGASPRTDLNQIKAVAGATISSRSVCAIVNEALTAELRARLVEALAQDAPGE